MPVDLMYLHLIVVETVPCASNMCICRCMLHLRITLCCEFVFVGASCLVTILFCNTCFALVSQSIPMPSFLKISLEVLVVTNSNSFISVIVQKCGQTWFQLSTMIVMESTCICDSGGPCDGGRFREWLLCLLFADKFIYMKLRCLPNPFTDSL